MLRNHVGTDGTILLLHTVVRYFGEFQPSSAIAGTTRKEKNVRIAGGVGLSVPLPAFPVHAKQLSFTYFCPSCIAYMSTL